MDESRPFTPKMTMNLRAPSSCAARVVLPDPVVPISVTCSPCAQAPVNHRRNSFQGTVGVGAMSASAVRLRVVGAVVPCTRSVNCHHPRRGVAELCHG